MEERKTTFQFIANGYAIHSDDDLLIDEFDVVPMTWTERLFSLPWRPWKRSYIVKLKVPDPQLYVDEEKKIMYGHPNTVHLFSRAIIEKMNEIVGFDKQS